MHIDPAATGVVNNYDYRVYGSGISTLLGDAQFTTMTNATLTDVQLSMTDNNSTIAWNSPVTYTMVAYNDGPNAVTNATLVDNFPANLSGVTWTCTGSGGGTCGVGARRRNTTPSGRT